MTVPVYFEKDWKRYDKAQKEFITKTAIEAYKKNAEFKAEEQDYLKYLITNNQQGLPKWDPNKYYEPGQETKSFRPRFNQPPRLGKRLKRDPKNKKGLPKILAA